MIIRTARNSYLMIGYIKQEAQSEVYLCENTENRTRCLMVRIMDSELIRSSVGFLYEQAESWGFTDFEECAVDGENLLTVFAYPQGQSLEEKLAGEYTGMAERLDIVGHVLEKLILQDMAPYFAARCLRPGGVWVTRSGKVSFLYDLAGAERCTDFSMQEVSAAVCGLLERVFEEELKKEMVPELKEFLRDLEKDSFADYVELYRKFQELREVLLGLPQEVFSMPKTWDFRVWERITKLFHPLKRLAALALLIAALVYMAWTIRTAFQPSASMNLLDQIGTLDIP